MRDNTSVDVSIIMPVYNHERFLSKAIESVLAQDTDYTYELLIGEDCSTDNSRKIVVEYAKMYPKIIRAFCRKNNMGGTKNIYSLCMKAKGRYIAFLEGDDYWCDSHKIQKQIYFLDNNKEYIGVACNFYKVNEKDIVLEESCIDENMLPMSFRWVDYLKEGFLIQTATIIFRNIFLEDCDYSVLYKAHDIVGDVTFLTILLNRSNIYILQDVMSVYREIIKEGESNARSIAASNQGLAIYKGIRQLDRLRPYLNNSSDYDIKISCLKADYLIKLIKKTDSYSFLQWKKICKIGKPITNVKALRIMIGQVIKRLYKDITEIRKLFVNTVFAHIKVLF